MMDRNAAFVEVINTIRETVSFNSLLAIECVLMGHSTPNIEYCELTYLLPALKAIASSEAVYVGQEDELPELAFKAVEECSLQKNAIDYVRRHLQSSTPATKAYDLGSIKVDVVPEIKLTVEMVKRKRGL